VRVVLVATSATRAIAAAAGDGERPPVRAMTKKLGELRHTREALRSRQWQQLGRREEVSD
jgi:hypothetical protein